MGKYIKIEVKSARLPLQNKSANDREFSLSLDGKKMKYGDIDRKNFIDFKNPIHIGNITGMLHVLFGARPKPSKRICLYYGSNIIDNIANNGLILIKTPYTRISNKNEIFPLTEFSSGKKMPQNSQHNKCYTSYKNGVVIGDITWHTLKYRFILGRIEKYENIKNFIEERLKIDDIENNITLLDALYELSNSEFKEESIVFFKNEELTPFSDFIADNNKINFNSCNTYKTKLAARNINTHPFNEMVIDCDMLFEVTEEQYEDLLNGTQCATFLDGGYAKLIPDFYLDECYISNINEYTKIKEL